MNIKTKLKEAGPGKIIFWAVFVFFVSIILVSITSCSLAGMRNIYTTLITREAAELDESAAPDIMISNVKDSLEEHNLLHFCEEINVYKNVVVVKMKNTFIQALYRGEYEYTVIPYEREE